MWLSKSFLEGPVNYLIASPWIEIARELELSRAEKFQICIRYSLTAFHQSDGGNPQITVVK